MRSLASKDWSKTIAAAMAAPGVQAAVRAKRDRILPRAQRLAAQAGALEFSRALHAEEGVRPGSKAGGFRRPYARVSADVTDELRAADAGARITRRSILRRASSA